MLPIRRLALVQATRALRPSTTFRSSFHTSTWSLFPLPTSTDSANQMDSKNTEGQGLNEKGSGNKNVPNAHNVDRTTSNAGIADPSHTPTASHSRTPRPSPSTPTTDEVKTSVKRAGRQAKAKVESAAESVGEAVRHTAASAKVGLSKAKEDVTHAVNTGKNRVKASARDAQQSGVPTQPHATAQDGTVFAMSRPSTSYSNAGRTPQTSGYVGEVSAPGGILGNVDTESVKAKAKETANNVKAGLSSVVDTVKSVAHNVADSIKSTTSTASAKARDMKENTGERLQSFGERMEAKFEKFGDNLMKSGEAIEQRNQQPDPLPQPLPLDEVDHMPNPKDLNEVLPGTGPKDNKKNEPITDSRERGQFPG